METAVGREYAKAMTNWKRGGSHPDLKPDWADRDDDSLFDSLEAAETCVEDSEAVVRLVDDGRARTALRQNEDLNLDSLSRRAFIAMPEHGFGIENAAGIWPIIEIGAGVNEPGKSRVPDPLAEDPIHVRKRSWADAMVAVATEFVNITPSNDGSPPAPLPRPFIPCAGRRWRQPDNTKHR